MEQHPDSGLACANQLLEGVPPCGVLHGVAELHLVADDSLVVGRWQPAEGDVVGTGSGLKYVNQSNHYIVATD